MQMRTAIGLAAAGMLLFAGCGKKSDGGGNLGTLAGKAAGLEWSVPAKWTLGPEKPMRVATYHVPSAQGDAEGGECYVSFFGTGQGGVVEANIERWVSQFSEPGMPEKSTKEVNGLSVTTVRIAGTFLGSGMGMGAPGGAPNGSPKENYRLLAAIVEAPEGMVFFKMTGPAATVGAAENDFNALIGSLKK